MLAASRARRWATAAHPRLTSTPPERAKAAGSHRPRPKVCCGHCKTKATLCTPRASCCTLHGRCTVYHCQYPVLYATRCVAALTERRARTCATERVLAHASADARRRRLVHVFVLAALVLEPRHGFGLERMHLGLVVLLRKPARAQLSVGRADHLHDPCQYHVSLGTP